MNSNNKWIFSLILIMGFLLPIFLVQQPNLTNQIITNNSDSVVLNFFEVHEEDPYVITESVDYSNDQFSGQVHIKVDGIIVTFTDCDFQDSVEIVGNGIIVSFTGCSFSVTKLKILGNAIVEFNEGCDLTCYTLDIREQAEVIFTGCTVTVPEVEPHPLVAPHRFQVQYDSSITIQDNSEFFISDTLIEIDYSQINILSDSIVNFNCGLDISYDSTAIIDDSTINGGDITIADKIDDSFSVLTITDSTINARILDLEKYSEVSISGADSIVNCMLNTIWVTGSVKISDDIIMEGIEDQDYTIKSYDFDEAATINYQNVVMAHAGAEVSIESSYLYALAAACRVDVANSIIDSIHPDGGLSLFLENSVILGEGGTCQMYGSVSPLGQNYIETGEGTSFISFVNCEVQGIIQPFRDLTVVFQHSTYDEAAKELLIDQVESLVGDVIFVEMESEVDLSLWGFRGISGQGKLITDASLTLDGEDYHQGLQFSLNPTHLDLEENHFEIDAYISGDPDPVLAFSREFTVEIVDDDEEPPMIEIQYEGLFTPTEPGEWRVYVSDESGLSSTTFEIDGAPPTQEGNYAGLYSFTDQQEGDDPEGWDFYETSESDIRIVGELDGHRNVVELYRPFASTEWDTYMWDEFTPKHGEGDQIEFWFWGLEHTILFFELYDLIDFDFFFATQQVFVVYKIDETPDSAFAYIPVDLPIETWNHFRIQINAENFEFWINGISIGTFKTTEPATVGYYHTAFQVASTHTLPISGYIDAIDYSWDPSGFEGRNQWQEFDVPAKPGDHTITVTATDNDNDRPGDQMTKIVSHMVSIVEPLGSLVSLLMVTPDLDLHVYNGKGDHVGVDYNTNEVEIAIPGAMYSGDVSIGMEWIYLPPDVGECYVVIDARDAHDPIEDYQLTIFTITPEGVPIQITQDATIAAGTTDTWDPEIDPDTGELELPRLESTITEKFEDLREVIMQLDDGVFDKNPNQRRSTINNKIQALINLAQVESYGDAYNKLLHDLKPKLTGLKTDENGMPWGNGVFKNPWVVETSTQALLQDICDTILFALKLLI
jgi:hypothetical protein